MSAERRSAVTTTSCNSSALLAAAPCGAASCAQAPAEQASDAATAAAHCDRPRPVPLSHRAIPITPVRLLVCWTRSRGHGADRERACRGRDLGRTGAGAISSSPYAAVNRIRVDSSRVYADALPLQLRGQKATGAGPRERKCLYFLHYIEPLRARAGYDSPTGVIRKRRMPLSHSHRLIGLLLGGVPGGGRMG